MQESHKTLLFYDIIYLYLYAQKLMKNIKIIVAAVAFVACGIIFSCSRGKSEEVTDLSQMQTQAGEIEPEDSEEDGQTGSVMKENATCFVYVCGAVVNPGVIELEEGSRVADAIKEAGGLSEGAVPEYLNLAATVADGEKIYVPNAEETDGSGTMTFAPAQNAKVNINTATAEELKTLSGIGDKRAADIISYRESHGNFKSIEDIMQVPGIKNAAFEKIKDDITV